MFDKELINLYEVSLHPPALDAGGHEDDAEIPSVLLEYNAYVADRRNDTTAVAVSRCGREVQVTFFAARPPRVSYLCVFCRPAATDEAEHQQMIPMEPEVVATEDNLVLLRIIVSPEKDLINGSDLYIYRPAGGDGPSLKRLPRPQGNIILVPNDVGILSCPANDDHDGSTGLSLLRPHRAPQDKFYMVAALCNYRDLWARGRGRFILHVYNSKLETWTATNVSVEDQHFQKYQDQGCLIHSNTRVIAVGGEDGTIAFIDLWRGILLCDLSHVKGKPWLRYVPLPGPSGMLSWGDACRSRDIAVVRGHFKFVRNRFWWKDCPTCSECIDDGWNSALWTRPVSASSLLDDSWQLVFDMESSGMDVKSSPDFEILPKLGDSNSPFQMLDISHPTLSWNYSDTTVVWFMIKMKHGDAKAWVIAVDIMNNRLQGVAEFDAGRYTATGYAYLHSRISKYLNKRAPANSSASDVIVTVPIIADASIKDDVPIVTLDVTDHDVPPLMPSAISNDSDSNAMSVIPPQFGGLPFDEKYKKNMGKFTATGLSSKIIFKGAVLLRSEEKMKQTKYVSIGSMQVEITGEFPT